MNNKNDMLNKVSRSLFKRQYPKIRKDKTWSTSVTLEQYKLLIDSAHKVEERRSGSNNIFIGANTIMALIIVNYPKEAGLKAPLIATLAIAGIFMALYWLRMIRSYEKVNFINYCLISVFEKLMPTSVFSLRAQLGEDALNGRANEVSKNERFLPKVFLLIYFIVLLISISDQTNISKFLSKFTSKVLGTYAWLWPMR